MRINCHLDRQSVPGDLYEMLERARWSTRGGDAVMIRRLAVLGLERAGGQGQAVQLATVGVPSPASTGRRLVIRLEDDSPLSMKIRDWRERLMLDASTVVLQLAKWGWELSLSRSPGAPADGRAQKAAFPAPRGGAQ